jgi:hypothetical protein
MKSIQLKKLALASYTKEKLDIRKVNRLISFLKKTDLRRYIKYLKLIEKSKNITVVLPSKIDIKTENSFKKVYKDKNVNFVYDPSLILGLKILDNDFVYEYNLKDTIGQLSNFITE